MDLANEIAQWFAIVLLYLYLIALGKAVDCTCKENTEYEEAVTDWIEAHSRNHAEKKLDR